MIEASIVEVTLTDDMQYGLQWTFNNARCQRRCGDRRAQQSSGRSPGRCPGRFLLYVLRNSLGNVRAVLNALAEKSLVKVISSPSLMVMDNHTAQIVVGNQQPIQSATTTTTGGVVTNSIQYKDTGVALAVTPSVNAGNMVTMSINQAVTDVGQIDAATGQRAFLQRQITSKVAVRSGRNAGVGRPDPGQQHDGVQRRSGASRNTRPGRPVRHQDQQWPAHRVAGHHHPAGGAFRPGCASK